MGVKTPWALGVAAGGLMLAQAMITTPEAAAQGCTVHVVNELSYTPKGFH